MANHAAALAAPLLVALLLATVPATTAKRAHVQRAGGGPCRLDGGGGVPVWGACGP